MTTIDIPAPTRKQRASLARSTLRRSPMARWGIILLFALTLLAFIHPVLQATVWSDGRTIYHPTIGYDPAISHPSGPGPGHLLGTDPLGRDVVSLITFGLRPSFLLAVTVAISATVLGLLAGTMAAALRGRGDRVISTLADALVLLPPPLVFLVVVRGRPDWTVIHYGVIYGIIFGMGPVALVARSRAMAVMQKPFIDAARISGARSRWIVRRHLMPQVLPHAAIAALGGVVGAIIAQAFIEFLGAGSTHRGSLGALVYDSITYSAVFSTGVPWNALLAGALTISLLATSFYMISAGLRDAMDPRLAARGG